MWSRGRSLRSRILPQRRVPESQLARARDEGGTRTLVEHYDNLEAVRDREDAATA